MSRAMTGRVALVTGGSRGIGRAIAVRLAQAGAQVYINFSSRQDAAEETAELCRGKGAVAESLGFDVANAQAVDGAFARIMTQSGRLDILVNNAGITRDALLIRTKDEDWQTVMNTNLSGAFYCSRAAARLMMKARQGVIVNVSSVVGEMGNPGQAAYVASKAGLIGLTKSLAKEMAGRGIRVNAVTPGFIETEMTTGLSEKLREEYLKVIPLNRFGTAAEVAEAVTFLASDQSSYISGQILGINGGLYM